jgi:hypothetical protein
MNLRKFALVPIAAASLGLASQAQADWVGFATDVGVQYTLSFEQQSDTLGLFTLTLDTSGYSGTEPAYLHAVDIKGWGGPNDDVSFTLQAAPGGTGSWDSFLGPTSGGPSAGCGGSNAGFACVETDTAGAFALTAQNIWEFEFLVTHASGNFLTDPFGVAHIGAVYTNAEGSNAGYPLTSVAVIPEPETYALLLAGLGLLGFVASRRRKAMGVAYA